MLVPSLDPHLKKFVKRKPEEEGQFWECVIVLIPIPIWVFVLTFKTPGSSLLPEQSSDINRKNLKEVISYKAKTSWIYDTVLLREFHFLVVVSRGWGSVIQCKDCMGILPCGHEFEEKANALK